MYVYDIRKQIRIENKTKLIGEMCIMIVLVSITALLILNCNLKNPFIVAKPTSDKMVEEKFKQGIDYVKFDGADLEFTGYYKMNEKNKIIYNCYSIKFDKLKYFVFVPANRSGEDQANPEKNLKNYSFTAKVEIDNDLFDMVARDYGLNKDEFLKAYGVSNIVFDEAKSDRLEMYALCFLFSLIVVVCIIYLVLSLRQVNEITRNKHVRQLSKYGDIDKILDTMNEEIKNGRIFDSGKVKITNHWVIGFFDGNVSIFSKSNVKNLEVKKEIRLAYGVLPAGTALYLIFSLVDQTKHKIHIDSKVHAEEVLEIFKQEQNSKE